MSSATSATVIFEAREGAFCSKQPLHRRLAGRRRRERIDYFSCGGATAAPCEEDEAKEIWDPLFVVVSAVLLP